MKNRLVSFGCILITSLLLFGCEKKQSSDTSENVLDTNKTEVTTNINLNAEELYQLNCGTCHDGPVPKAPHRIKFSMFGADSILASMTEGVMKTQASMLSEQQKISLAEHLGEGQVAQSDSTPIVLCEPTTPTNEVTTKTGELVSWGVTDSNTRFIDTQTAKLTTSDIPKLKLKWTFAYPKANRARSQPTVHNGVIYVGSQTGTVYALSLNDGCAKWTYKADAEVRVSASLDVAASGELNTLFFGDFNGNVYAINATDASLKWKMNLDDHPDLTITGSPKLHNNILYVPMSSREWATAADPDYACCTFRGGVAAINATTGERLWTTYTVKKPTDTGNKNANGVATFAPSGAPVWNSPTIDSKRNLLYVGSGENYSTPATNSSDAIIAMDLDSGEIAWTHQALSGDAWNMACFVGGGANCPKENGPDLDIGAPPVLFKLSNGKDILLVGQKSGHVFALDPDNDGALLWKRKLGLGGFDGGVHWGIAADKDTLYVPIADVDYNLGPDEELNPGLFAIDPATGSTKWHTPTTKTCIPADKPGCNPGISASVTAIDGAVFAGSLDGKLLAFDSQNGKLIWSFQTAIEFESVSGEMARGGSIESDGPMIVDGHVLINSGYSFGGKMPGNALLVFSVDGNK